MTAACEDVMAHNHYSIITCNCHVMLGMLYSLLVN